jgi:hypothetical protein
LKELNQRAGVLMALLRRMRGSRELWRTGNQACASNRHDATVSDLARAYYDDTQLRIVLVRANPARPCEHPAFDLFDLKGKASNEGNSQIRSN